MARRLLTATPRSPSLPGGDTIEINSASPLRERFETLVMCDFTPRRPGELPMARWVSYKQLLGLLQPHATPTEVRHTGPGNLKQLITAWYTRTTLLLPASKSAGGARSSRITTRRFPLAARCLQVLLPAHTGTRAFGKPGCFLKAWPPVADVVAARAELPQSGREEGAGLVGRCE